MATSFARTFASMGLAGGGGRRAIPSFNDRTRGDRAESESAADPNADWSFFRLVTPDHMLVRKLAIIR